MEDFSAISLCFSPVGENNDVLHVNKHKTNLQELGLCPLPQPRLSGSPLEDHHVSRGPPSKVPPNILLVSPSFFSFTGREEAKCHGKQHTSMYPGCLELNDKYK